MPPFAVHPKKHVSRPRAEFAEFSPEPWPSFEDILHRLHAEGIYIHADQLAEFLLCHGLPVDLRYVPNHLLEKATRINQNYAGDMVKLADDPPQLR